MVISDRDCHREESDSSLSDRTMRGQQQCRRRERPSACSMGIPGHRITLSSVIRSLNPAALDFRMTSLFVAVRRSSYTVRTGGNPCAAN
jgi:hypothetical protein